jgi:hypothetical protein
MGSEEGIRDVDPLEIAEGIGQMEDQAEGEISSLDHWLDRVTESADRYFSDHLYESRTNEAEELSDVLP